MTCLRCRADNSPGRRFCGECGAPLAVPCGSCGFSNESGIKFCGGCGASLGAVPATATAKFASPETYTPKHLAEKILTSKSALEGERKQVTVLFADLKGSMELLADRDPEEARKILDPVLERMMESVHRYEGTVNQVMGDGIMALFGAPVAHEDHAVRACYAALRMQESVKRYAEEVQRARGVPIHIRVGLNSGEVVVRSIGSDLHMDYTAVGQTTHLAARMEQTAMPGSVLVTSAVLRLAEGLVAVKPLGPIAVKGLGEPVEAYELTGVGVVRTRLQAAAARGLTRFVGRDAEVEQLRSAREKAGQGHGQVVAVVGEPGVGKSRLFFEFTRALSFSPSGSWLVLESGSVSYGKATAYLPVIDLLKAYFRVEARDDARRVREKVSGKLVTLEEALLPTLPAFLALLDVAVEDAPWEALDPPQRRQRTLDAVRRLLLRESQVQPVLLVFEDLHWIDSETQAVLDSLVESLPTTHILLLVNYRPEYRHGWGSKTYYRQLQVAPLPPESAEELLGSLLGDDASLAPLKRLLIQRTEGSPFFLEESVRTLIETKVLTGERSAHRLGKPVTQIQVPATVQAVLAARIDRLPPGEKSLLQMAAVIGKDVPGAVLLVIGELPEPDFQRGLAHLQAAEFLYETRLFPEREFTFKHALTHEVAYSSLLQERRRILHSRIVEVLEALYSERLAEQVDCLAHHAVRGAVWDKALAYGQQAGEKAMARSAYREATGYFEQSLAALAHLPETRDTLEQAIDLRCDLRNALLPLGEQARIFEHLRAAEVLAERLGDVQRLGRIASYLCIYFSIMGEHARAITAGQRALALATSSEAFDVQVVTQTYLGLAYHDGGDFQRARDFCQRARALLTGERCYAHFGQVNLPAVAARNRLAGCLAELGDFAEGRGVGEEAVRIAEAVAQPYSLASALMFVGVVYRQQGTLHTAIPMLERGLALCQSVNIQVFFPRTASSLGAAYALAGRTAEAQLLLDQVLEPIASRSGAPFRTLVLTELSEALLLVDRVDEASAMARQLLELSRSHTGRGYQAHACRLLGEVAMRREPPDVDQAAAHYRQAIALASELGMRPLVAHCHLGLGKLSRRTRKREQAQEHLTTATTMYREMDMRFWLEQAEVEMRYLS